MPVIVSPSAQAFELDFTLEGLFVFLYFDRSLIDLNEQIQVTLVEVWLELIFTAQKIGPPVELKR